MYQALDLLAAQAGQYRGQGQNFVKAGINLGGTFAAFLEVQPGNLKADLDYWRSGEIKPVEGMAVQLRFRALPQDKTAVHEELAIIAKDEAGMLRLWQYQNDSAPIVFELCQFEPYDEGEMKITFGRNPDLAQPVVRAETTLEFWPDGTATYSYSWGAPGDFKPRWAARLQRPG